MSLHHWQAGFIQRGTRRSYFEGGDTKDWGVPAGTAPPCESKELRGCAAPPCDSLGLQGCAAHPRKSIGLQGGAPYQQVHPPLGVVSRLTQGVGYYPRLWVPPMNPYSGWVAISAVCEGVRMKHKKVGFQRIPPKHKHSSRNTYVLLTYAFSSFTYLLFSLDSFDHHSTGNLAKPVLRGGGRPRSQGGSVILLLGGGGGTFPTPPLSLSLWPWFVCIETSVFLEEY